MSSRELRKFMNLFEHTETSYKQYKINPIITEILEEVKNNTNHPFKTLNPKAESKNVLSFDTQAAMNFYGHDYAEKILKNLISVDQDFGSYGVEKLKEENGRIYYEFKDNDYKDKIEKVADPQIHTYDTYDSEDVYDITQSDDNIKDGDVLVVKKEKIIGILVGAWPYAITSNVGMFHKFVSDQSWNNMENGKYLESYKKALEIKKQLGYN